MRWNKMPDLKEGDVQVLSGTYDTKLGRYLTLEEENKRNRKRPNETARSALNKLYRDRSYLEEAFETHWRQLGGPDVWSREQPFHGERNWRWDFSNVKFKIAVEIDGGERMTGAKGHGFGDGMVNDYEKQNAAMIEGWVVFRLSTTMVIGAEWPKFIEPIIEYVKGL